MAELDRDMRSWVSDLCDVTSTGDEAHFRPARPVDVYYWGIIVLDELDVASANMDFALDKRVTAGSDTGRTEIDDMIFSAADNHGGTATGDVPNGDVWYRKLAIAVAEATGDDGVSLINVAPTGPIEVLPGQELVFETAVAPTTDGDVAFFVIYVEKGFNETFVSATNIHAAGT